MLQNSYRLMYAPLIRVTIFFFINSTCPV